MLRLVNAHRFASVVLVAAIVLVVVTLFGHNRGDTDSTSSVTVDQPAGSVSPTGRTEELVDNSSSTPGQATGGDDAPSPVDDPTRLDVPTDPSGVRLDRSEEGARQVAVDFAGTVQQRLLYLTDDSVRDLLAAWSADGSDPQQLDAAIAELSALRSMLTSGGGAVWWSVSPVASKLDAYDVDRARVSVWVAQVVAATVDPAVGGEAVAPTVEFRTTIIDLTWTDIEGWSVWNTTSTPGPVPMMSPTSTMTSPFEFMDTLGSFTLVKEHS